MERSVAAETKLIKDGICQDEFLLRKRLPRKLPKRKVDLYVNRRTKFKAQLERCSRMLENGSNEIFIHGLGAAINRAITLALQIQSNTQGTLQVAVNTSTVELMDDLEPESDTVDPDIQTRFNSAVHIKVFCADSAGLVNQQQNRITHSAHKDTV